MKNLIAALILVTLAACTSSTTGGTSPSGSAAGATSAGGSSSVCGLIAKSDAEAVVGTVSDTPTGTSAPSMPGVADKASVCVYRGASGLLTVAVLDRATTKADFDNIAKQVPGAQPISGLGDAAYGASSGASGAAGASVLVLKGSKYLSLSVTSSSKTADALLDGLKTLARSAVTKL